MSNAKSHTKIKTKLYCFQEIRYFVWKFENFDERQLPCSSIFFAETLYTFPTYQCLQECEGFILFWLDLELFAKIKKTCFLHTRFLYFYNSRLSKIQVKIIYICFISMYETFKSSRSQGVEAAFCRCFSKYVFFKIPQYSQQNIYVGVRPANLLKSDFNTGVFLWILRNF